TPVVTADHPGGREIRGLFPKDVRVVSGRNPAALANGIAEALTDPKRSSSETQGRIDAEFRPDAAVEKYLSLYRQATGRGTAHA
ncbi:MAG: hypothetical protein GY953_26455, partial [bacterium]|nr:hypothetical protein [bacterium]